MTWRALLEDQAGVLSRVQALAGGMTKHEWDWKLSSGRWQAVLRGVAVGHSGPVTEVQRLWAACLYGGREAFLSGDAVLLSRGVKVGPLAQIDVVVPADRQLADGRFEGGPRVKVHRVRAPLRLAWESSVLPMLTPHAAVLHAAAWATSDRAAEWRVAAAVQRRITAPVLLRSTLVELPRLPRRALVRAVLDDVELGAHAGSELAYLRFCRRYGLPLPDELQVKVRAKGSRYVDARYRAQRVWVEVDGRHHMEVGQWESDLLRTLEVTVALPGEQLVRLTPGMMRHDGPQVASLLGSLLLGSARS
jgi:hypothetical protein